MEACWAHFLPCLQLGFHWPCADESLKKNLLANRKEADPADPLRSMPLSLHLSAFSDYFLEAPHRQRFLSLTINVPLIWKVREIIFF
jgi:hypothetical protein